MIIKSNVLSKGYCFGKAFILNEKKIIINNNKLDINNIKKEISCFIEAHKKTIKQFKKIKSSLIDKDKKLLFDGYIILLEDECLIKDVINLIKNNYFYADAAVNKVIKNQINDIKKINNLYIKERANDILDIGKKLIYNIKNINLIDFNFLDKKSNIIIISKDLSPSQIIQFNLKKIVGFIIKKGSITSHTSIIAKSLNIIGVIQFKNSINLIKNNDNLIIDGISNNVYINPNKKILNKFKYKYNFFLSEKKKLDNLKNTLSITSDGHRIKLFANIVNNKDVLNIFKYGAEGIGLYRTEFLFMDRNSFPSEDEQFSYYKEIINFMNNKVVTIRTVDLGGDKFLPYMNFPKDNTPFLGWRSIRIYRDKTYILRIQLKAIFRASIYGNNVRILFPMIISIEEVKFIKNEINKIKSYLDKNNILYNKKIKIGAMIETPASALIINHLCKELDFFSIGTNDLTQYVLAVDRTNTLVSYLYEPLSPSIIYLIKYVVDVIHKNNKKVGMCGELASDDKSTILLLGLGLDELSMSSNFIPKIKNNIIKYSFNKAKKITYKILKKNNIKDIKNILNKIKI